MKTIYAYGDSFTYGHNLDNKNLTYPNLVMEKLGYVTLKNNSIPAGSNWRTTRQIQNQNFDDDDLVLIGWSSPERIELGVNPKSDLNSNLFYKIVDKNRKISSVGDYLEEDGYLKLKRFYPQMVENCSDIRVEQFSNIFYTHFYNEDWFSEMFRVMYWATISALERKNVKWIMFDIWCGQESKNILLEEEVKNKNYIFSGENNCLDAQLRKISKQKNKNLHCDKKLYWNEDGHEMASQLIVDKYFELYGR